MTVLGMPPDQAVWLGLGLTLGGTLGLLGATHVRSMPAEWLSKPTASAGFLVTGLGAGALETTYGTWVFVGLVLGLAGDVLLIPRSDRVFKLGIAAFLLGHVAYVGAFVALGVAPLGAAAALAAASALGWLIWRWLRPHTRELTGAAAAYVVVITLMLALAAGAVLDGASPYVLGGAAGFWASDLTVARERFVTSSFWNRFVGLPLYMGSQTVIALTVSPNWLGGAAG